ncbi:MAG: NADH-quinone oxidoreductase subunit F, partial [Planctomycetia bacterium]
MVGRAGGIELVVDHRRHRPVAATEARGIPHRRLPGGYICGEQSALIEAMEDRRAQPRTKPPRSVEEGIWKRPTVANNTETLANIPDIILKGGEWYASIGTEGSKGTKLMTVQGPMNTPGLVEVPMGITLRTLM